MGQINGFAIKSLKSFFFLLFCLMGNYECLSTTRHSGSKEQSRIVNFEFLVEGFPTSYLWAGQADMDSARKQGLFLRGSSEAPVRLRAGGSPLTIAPQLIESACQLWPHNQWVVAQITLHCGGLPIPPFDPITLDRTLELFTAYIRLFGDCTRVREVRQRVVSCSVMPPVLPERQGIKDQNDRVLMVARMCDRQWSLAEFFDPMNPDYLPIVQYVVMCYPAVRSFVLGSSRGRGDLRRVADLSDLLWSLDAQTRCCQQTVIPEKPTKPSTDPLPNPWDFSMGFRLVEDSDSSDDYNSFVITIASSKRNYK